ncbi:hypothetical protein P175DRAFT_0526835 [Aspergillus ochraceoroseus IBT 24754]|uniref:Uncharacterized protein n=1 Tax=Aspergillus ochraceoroseus IBT 24754 TaxID=1392256 RepID=A0A2T5LM79_9EURO|nr:uncharacterized protein P175DRAFT_0526835 [Aspergillus ochraceoroseus IBT 24754]PTU17385.1 hypothetical protein P175DRAFT_0526835 [Aspergillus ochraceoroseus IBT 24754]
MTRLSFLAVCLNLALLVSAAPVKRSDGDDMATAQVAADSLQSAAKMMQQMSETYGASTDENADVGNNMPVPNTHVTFPSSSGKAHAAMHPATPEPEEEEDPEAAAPSAASTKANEEADAATPSSPNGILMPSAAAAASVPSASASVSAERLNSDMKSKPAAEPSADDEAAAAPAAAPSHQAKNDPLSGLPLVGGLLSGGGLL